MQAILPMTHILGFSVLELRESLETALIPISEFLFYNRM